ncbi:hypothetical protein JCM7686_0780 [Paracoccus aminophilus JCM 7686]|uniref:Antitoxin Xre/MbcA/ParS-like toxin-binding domain-containing protein n=2 Tax=Paracoccus aminophilus TaxID=34003 RepID=S5XKZ9_PARAH|nr:hypothetical protein JCM7686_0780 [Paracoccus aminophilus JCM 7686]
MDQLIAEIEVYTAARGISPQNLLRKVINAPWGQWQKWKDGTSSPTMIIADKLRDFMVANPAVETPEDAT